MAQTLTFQEAAEIYAAGIATATGPITWIKSTSTTCFPTTYIPTAPPVFAPAPWATAEPDQSEEITHLKRELAIVTADRDELLGVLHPEELL